MALVRLLGDEVALVERPGFGWRVVVASSGHELAPTVKALEAYRSGGKQKRKAVSMEAAEPAPAAAKGRAAAAVRPSKRAKKVDEGRVWEGVPFVVRQQLLAKYPSGFGEGKGKGKGKGNGKGKGKDGEEGDRAEQVSQPRRKKVLLVLDVNGLLVHRERPWNRDAVTQTLKRGPDRAFPRFVCWDRPYVRPFLRWALLHFEVGVWSSMMPVNVGTLVAHTFGEVQGKLKFVHGRPMCDGTGTVDVRGADRVTKRLDKVWEGHGEGFTLLLDDSVDKTAVNPAGTCIVPKAFHPARVDAAEDTALGPEGEITTYLAKLLEAVEGEGKTVQEFVLANPLAPEGNDEAWAVVDDEIGDGGEGEGGGAPPPAAAHPLPPPLALKTEGGKAKAQEREGGTESRKAAPALAPAPPAAAVGGGQIEIPPQEKYETAAEYSWRSGVYLWALAALGDPAKALTACKVASNVHRLGATYPPEVMANIRRFMPESKPGARRG